MAAKVKASLELDAQNNTDKALRQVNESLRNTARTLQVVQGPLGPIAGRFTALSSALGSVSLSGLGLTAAITGSIFAFKKGADEWANAEKQLLQLEAQLNATGFAAGKSSRELEDLAQGVARATLASLEEVRQAEGILLSFRSITEEAFDRSLIAAQDLAAAGFGSITDASKQLGKALEDPVTGLSSLRRAGVTFNETEKDMIQGFIDIGDKASAMSLILDGIEKQVGGAGAAQGQGLAGAFDSLAQSTKNFWTQLGKTSAGQWFKEWINDAADGIQNMADAMASIPDAPMTELIDRIKDAYDTVIQKEKYLADLRKKNEESNFIKTPTIAAEQEVEAAKEKYNILVEEFRVRKLSNEEADKASKIAQEEIARQESIARAKERQAELDKAAAKRAQEIARWHREVYGEFVKEQRALDQIAARLDPIGALTSQFLDDWNAVAGLTMDAATQQEWLNALTNEYADNLQAAKDEMNQLSEAEQEVYDNAEAIGNILADGFKSATLEGQKFADVMNDVLGRVAAKLLDVLIIENLVQGFAGAATSFFSSSPSGGAPIVDKGTPYVPQANIGGPVEGRTLIGEAGPEILYPPKRMKLDPIIIGEKGPEVLDFPKGSFIKSNRELKQMTPPEPVVAGKPENIIPFPEIKESVSLDRQDVKVDEVIQRPPKLDINLDGLNDKPPASPIPAPKKTRAPADILPFPVKQEKTDEEKIEAITGKALPKRSTPMEIGGKPYVGSADTGGFRSGPTMVGETGPEIIDLPKNTYVTSNREIQKVSPEVTVNVINNGPPVEVDVHKESRGDGSQLINVVLNRVAESVSNNGIVGRSIQQTFGTRQRVITR